VAREVDAQTSSLWGVSGETWDPAGMLGDFSFAGYRTGNVPIPDRSNARIDVRTFGAVAGDGGDDTVAFQSAIDAAQPGQAVYAPAGTWDFQGLLKIQKSGISLQGDGPGQTVLYFHRNLTEISGSPSLSGVSFPLDEDVPGATTCPSVDPPPMVPGEPWSFVGGVIWIEGQDPIDATTRLATVSAPAMRGGHTLTLSSAAGITPGMWIRLTEADPPRTAPDTGSLARHLHGGLTDVGCEQTGRVLVDFHSQVTAVSGTSITLERPLPVDVRAEWKPEIHRLAPTIQDVGVERLTLQFPESAYPGHLAELGYNGIFFLRVMNSWVRNVDVLNCDTGVFMRWAHFNTLDQVRIASTAGRPCHHGFNLPFLDTDNLITRFNNEQECQHDLSVEQYSSGNVFSKGTGTNVNLDHHRAAPYQNLFTDIHLGSGSRPFDSGGAASYLRGPQTARYSTLWNVRAHGTIALPACDFGPEMLFIGVPGAAAGTCSGMKWHIEPIDPALLHPSNIHEAQLARRTGAPSATCRTSTPTWQNVAMAVQQSAFTVSFEVTPHASSMDGVIGLSEKPGAAYADYAAQVRFGAAGVIEARRAAEYAADVAHPYTSGATYRIRMVVDPPAHSYSVFVGPPGTEQQIANNYGFRTEQATASQIANWGVISSQGDLEVCLVPTTAPGSDGGVVGDSGVPRDGAADAGPGGFDAPGGQGPGAASSLRDQGCSCSEAGLARRSQPDPFGLLLVGLLVAVRRRWLTRR
jgi:hypothetical protein